MPPGSVTDFAVPGRGDADQPVRRALVDQGEEHARRVAGLAIWVPIGAPSTKTFLIAMSLCTVAAAVRRLVPLLGRGVGSRPRNRRVRGPARQSPGRARRRGPAILRLLRITACSPRLRQVRHWDVAKRSRRVGRGTSPLPGGVRGRPARCRLRRSVPASGRQCRRLDRGACAARCRARFRCSRRLHHRGHRAVTPHEDRRQPVRPYVGPRTLLVSSATWAAACPAERRAGTLLHHRRAVPTK